MGSPYRDLRKGRLAVALKPCRECGQQVSTEAATCPNCGVSNPSGSLQAALGGSQGKSEGCFLQTMNCGCMIVFAFIALVVLIGILA